MFKLKKYLLASSSIAALAAAGVVAPLTGGDLLLTGETNGMASDFTIASGAGAVSVKDVGTPANAVSNVIGDAFWGNAGTSPKLITTSAGALAWSPHNQVIQSETFENAAWTVTAITVTANDTAAPDGTTTADKIVESNTSTSFLVTTTGITIPITALHTSRIRVKRSNVQWVNFFVSDTTLSHGVQCWFDITNNVVGSNVPFGANAFTFVSASVVAATNGFSDIQLVFSSPTLTTLKQGIQSATADGGATRVSSGTYWLWGAQVNRGIVPTTYLATTTAAKFGLGIDFANSSYGLLVEPAATNLTLRSQESDNATWTKTDTTITADNTAAPDGTTTGDLLTEGVAGTASITTADTTIGSNSTNTVSLFLKRGNHDFVRVFWLETAAQTNRVTAWFNLTLGTVTSVLNGGTASGAAATITTLANGWFRVTMTGAINNAATVTKWSTSSASADASTTRVNNATRFQWGAQLEAGTVATSPIPTFAATVTRAKDGIQKATTAIPLGTSHTIYAEFAKRTTADRGVAINIADPDDADADDISIDGQAIATADQLRAYVEVNGALTFSALTMGQYVANTYYKIALGAATNNVNAALNGTIAGADDTVAALPVITIICAGNQSANSSLPNVNQLNGWVKKLIYLPRRMTNAELQTRTT